MTVSVTLRQEKITLLDKFVSVSWITVANPAGYFPLFVVSENAGDPADERFDKVATLNDLATYAENRLIKFECTVPGGVLVGDLLVIANAPDYWFDTYLTAAKFVVASIDSAYVLVSSTVPFPTALDGVNWSFWDPTETSQRGTSGTGGRCVRETLTGALTYLRRHLTKTFVEIKAAVDHVDSISAFLNSLIDAANLDATSFTPPPYTEVIS
jgi:hypothetical protein